MQILVNVYKMYIVYTIKKYKCNSLNMLKKTSIDPIDIEKFSKKAHEWWKIDGEFKILHQINPLRLHYLMDKIKHHFNIHAIELPLKDLNILDIGCGGGLITIPLSQQGGNLTAIDASEENILTAQEYIKNKGLKINFLKSTIEELAAGGEQYDVVLCLEVIEHVNNVEDFVRNIASVIKPNGMIILSTINRNIKSYLLAILAAEYILKIVPKKTHSYNKFLKPSELNLMLMSNNLSLKEMKGLVFNIANQTWQLSDNIDVNYFAYIIKAE